ncbi:dihydrolipoamide acetyltransferase family protein [Amycolatopsis endophytica]|uniref:Dihydrolipoamide acetyltransferase component of pyruvate dehydrogenase complex n=1 Tax=Amycolatopsis endophytica TaxID=860233 RepID=A0A853B479_9PSEU|nr:dihydrolipoamide acetyltransferase family protein [Amycolatopsis endophytica]NYI89819.1 pyruvate dehydrogenase E2 component (dihydrolipoamide acetyltransferase) [Amycolatopsis endophytica]
MSDTFTLPDLGEGLTEAQLVRWLVAVGDTIAVDAPVAEVETAKAMVEVPSPYGGVVTELHGEPGGTVQVGEPLITVGRPAAATYAEEERAGSGNVLIGYGTSAQTNGRRRRRRPAGLRTVVLDRPRTQSPIVRKLARERGVDLTGITGTGTDGLITRTDVERATAPRPDGDDRTGLGIRERVPLRGMRKAIATTLSRSRREIPEATTWVDADATALVELRESLSGTGLLALVARFVVAGLARFPDLNARVDDDEIVQFDGVNLGIATQAERGLVVPVVRRADRLSARELDPEIRRVVSTARDGAAPEAPGTFTLNNYGVFGVDGSAAIINHPEVAILGMGRIVPKPWVVDGQIVPRRMTQLSLVFDHRVCDGGTAAGFLRFVADAVENPLSALADL